MEQKILTNTQIDFLKWVYEHKVHLLDFIETEHIRTAISGALEYRENGPRAESFNDCREEWLDEYSAVKHKETTYKGLHLLQICSWI